MMSSSHPHTSALQAMHSGGLVPLFSSADADILYRLAETIVAAGLPVLEVTLRVPGALEALIRLMTRVDEEKLPLLVGAGTVLDRSDADAAMEAGARFVFSPVVDSGIADRCRVKGVPWIPGCATPTEINTAMQLGSAAVKLFPADTIGGPEFLRAVRAVWPDLIAIPSGGVVPREEVLVQWFGAGATAVAMGSNLFPAGAIEAGDWAEVRRSLERAAAAVTAARERLVHD